MLEDREPAVRERAYAIWERDGRPEGRNLDHWLQAEAEIGIRPLQILKPPAAVRVATKRRAQSANGVLKRRAKP